MDSYQEELERLRERIRELESSLEKTSLPQLPLDLSWAVEFFHYSPLETIVVDLEGRVTAYNIAKQKSKGRLPKIGDLMYRDYAAEHEIDMYAELMQCIEKKKTKTFSALKYHNKYLRITISPFPKGAIIVSQDVTEQKLTEEALRQSEARYRNVFNRVPVGLFSISKTGTILEVNQTLVHLLGYPDKQRFLQDNFLARCEVPDLLEKIQEIFLKEGALRDFEIPFRRFDNQCIWIRINAREVKDETTGELLHYEGVVEDITARKYAEEALRKSEQEKALILSSVLEVVTYQDLNRRIIWANQLAGEVFGVPPIQLEGRHCHELWGKSSTPCPGCPLPQILETGLPQHSEKQTPDGRFWFCRGYPVRNEQGNIIGIVEVHLDITERKKAEEEKAKIQQELFQAQKMEAIGTLAGGIAHDFNNLLTAIQGCLDLALIKTEEGSSLQKELLEVQKAVQRASQLTKQLLLFSRRHPIRFEPVLVNRIVDDLLSMLHRLIGENIEIVTSLDPHLWSVLGDSGTIEQILLNLAVNARDAMPQGGTLTIKTENIVLDELYCKMVPEAKPGRYVRISVSDTGIGMSPEVVSRIFEPFYSTKKPGKGTGLGLAVVYGIVKQHNGFIHVYSEPGQGTEFKIYFPAVEKQAKLAAPVSIRLDQLNGHGERILIVEDEEAVRDFTIRALEKYGYSVHAVDSVREALHAFRQEKGHFDLVFTDVVLPDDTGISMIENFLKLKPDLKVLLTSGYTDTKSQWKAIQKWKFPFLQKPFTLVDLLQTVRKALER